MRSCYLEVGLFSKCVKRNALIESYTGFQLYSPYKAYQTKRDLKINSYVGQNTDLILMPLSLSDQTRI